MLKQNRAYKKGNAHKDSRLFIIVAEGDREDGYFNFFNEINSRIQIKKVPRNEGKSSPKFFLERITNFEKSGDWTPEDGDEVWFICDVDKWEREHIDELNNVCDQNQNYNIAISNPCFEVWLHFHGTATKQTVSTCGELKETLPRASLGHYECKKYCSMIEEATRNAKNIDEHPTHYFPEVMNTKLYLLAEKMLIVLGHNWK